ncbi:hypothetical protein H8L32_08610 [Undibacterium sp. CY18W]|uniref:Secreted protein n=1 Tax=Undibacterium hunanense TaxID=2762292 RepID=A0ABR6ZNR2_9BURK|nr:hypothetical protein [Undibacterium hunanense]MBC3917530.1 hypothetical protein [Undibacterium hunanense]
MNMLKRILLVCSLLAVTFPAMAHSSHFRPRVSLGISINPFPIYYGARYSYGPRYYPYDYSYPYYSSVVIAPSVSYVAPVTRYTEVIEERTYSSDNESNVIRQPDINPQTNVGKDWLYCHQPDGFYPAIKNCPGGWQRVPAASSR